jgi:hypothetical protein
MKKFTIFMACFLSFAAGTLLTRYLTVQHTALADEKELILAQAQNQVQKKEDTWVAKVDETVITRDEFEREFNVHVYALPLEEKQRSDYRNDPEKKKKFLSSLINEYLIYNQAIKDGIEKRPEVQDLLRAVKRRAIIQVYLNVKIEPKLKDIPDEQIETIYNQNKKMYAGVDIEVAREQIKMLLLQRQYNDYLNEFVDELMGEAKVMRNEKAVL